MLLLSNEKDQNMYTPIHRCSVFCDWKKRSQFLRGTALSSSKQCPSSFMLVCEYSAASHPKLTPGAKNVFSVSCYK